MEGVLDFALAWMPYAAGFLSGYVDAGRAHEGLQVAWQEDGAHASGLSPEASTLLQWQNQKVAGAGQYVLLTLPGVQAEDGMLFALATDPGRHTKNVNVVGVVPIEDNSGWMLQVHEDFDEKRVSLAPQTEWGFAFLFVPFASTRNLHGAFVNGATGWAHRRAGRVSTGRITTGVYIIQVEGKGPLDGVLLLQCAGMHSTGLPASSNAFLSYEWRDDWYGHGSGFIVQARHVTPAEGGRRAFSLRDVDFYALWIDHREPPIAAAEAEAEAVVTDHRVWTGAALGASLLFALAAFHIRRRVVDPSARGLYGNAPMQASDWGCGTGGTAALAGDSDREVTVLGPGPL
jgi:hypothetical protein